LGSLACKKRGYNPSVKQCGLRKLKIV
jgi:hypothetical protein